MSTGNTGKFDDEYAYNKGVVRMNKSDDNFGAVRTWDFCFAWNHPPPPPPQVSWFKAVGELRTLTEA